jgi:hypothetical protein
MTSLAASLFFSAPSFPFLVFDLDLTADSLLDFGVEAPLAVFGVDDVLSLIFGFLTESDRCGV